MSGVRGLRAALIAVALLLLGVPALADAAPKTLRTGFMDGGVMTLDPANRATWLHRATRVGASVLRINLSWATVAPTRPPDVRAIDPGWAGYRFQAVDGQIAAAKHAGLRVLLNVSTAPAWAQEAGQPKGTRPGSWKPDPSAYGQFLTAVARRYSGHYADPLHPGSHLPRVTDFQLWNEPNLDIYLAPQWQNGKPFAPNRFRDLVNAGYRGIKWAQPKATVVAAGLAPYGDPGVGGHRIAPVRFLRSMLCVNSRGHRTCRARTHVNAISEHPYPIRKPSSPALNADDVAIPDLHKLESVLRAARRAKTVGPRLPKLWVTEVSYDSDPPDPDGVPAKQLSSWTAEMLWRLWKQGVDTVVWFLIRDQAPIPSYAASYQSGQYFLSGKRKSSARAFRFPVVVTSRTSRDLRVWLRSPRRGRARIQVLRGKRWRTVRRLTVRTNGVRTLKVPRAHVRRVRAVVAGETSFAWTVR